jgi:DNA-binding MarR family transcriptional regulator
MAKPAAPKKRRVAAEIVAAPADGEIRLGWLAGAIGYHLRLAQEASFQAFARHAGAVDLRPGRFAVLLIIAENPGLSQTALGRAAGRDKSSLTPVLDDLEGRGLVRRRRLAHDRRSYALSLTEAGVAALAELRAHAEAHDRALDQIVGAESKADFIRILRRIAMALS